MRSIFLALSIAAGLLAWSGGPSAAQAVRTWVSGVGDDANPCSRTAPCKTFAGAISKTAAGGEISVLDPGGFGAVTITKSISLVADGNEGSILASGTNGIIVNAGVNDVVQLWGLKLEGAGTGTTGVRILQAKEVYISKTEIRGFLAGNGRGIDVSPTTAAVRLILNKVEINNNLVGVYLHSGSGGASSVLLSNSVLTGNSTNTLLTDNTGSVIKAAGSVIIGAPFSATGGGAINSSGNNVIGGGGTFNNTVPLQ